MLEFRMYKTMEALRGNLIVLYLIFIC